MYRRRVLQAAVVGAVGGAGCLASDETTREAAGRDETDTPTASPTPSPTASSTAAVEAHVVACEREYIGTELLSSDDESITDRSGPRVVLAEARSDGGYVELETAVGTVRSADGEPDVHADYPVRAAYLVRDDDVYRTNGFDADGRPRDGTLVDC